MIWVCWDVRVRYVWVLCGLESGFLHNIRVK